MTIRDIGIINMENGCCKDRPVVIQKCIHSDGSVYYNCHCQCDMWVTSGHETIDEAVAEYADMTKLFKLQLRWRAI